MKTRQFLITLLIVFSAISSSFSQTKRFINEQYIFNVNPKSAGYDFKVLDSITASDTLALINNSVLGGKWVRGRNLPVKDVDINNYSHNGTLSSYLQGIDLALGAIQETTAGVLTRIYFTGDQTTITSGTYYLSNFTSKGTVADLVQTVNNADNTKTFFTQDIISSASLLTSTAKKGSYTSSLSVSTESAGTGNDYSQRFTIEIYLTDNDGVPIPSGVTGAPIGDLGVTVLTILDSGVLNMPYDAITNITLTGNLNEDIPLLIGNRVRYHISAEKIGTSGGAIDQSLYLGSDHSSYYDVPTPILWGSLEGVLSNQVDLQNALDAKEDIANKGIADGYASLDPSGKVPLSQINRDITIVGSGQSNMSGKHSGGDMTSDSRVFVWRKDLATPSWQVADLTQPPFNGNNNLLFQFAKKYAQTYDVEVKIILNADDWQDIERWLDTSPTMWTDLTTQITDSGTTGVDIVLWHQGEANYSNLTVPEYAVKFKALLDKFRSQNWFSEDTPFIAGELLNVYPAQNGFYQNPRYNDWIKYKNFTVAQASDLTGEPTDAVPFLHFSGEELVLLGRERYWNAWKAISEQYTPVNKGFFKRLNNKISIGENVGGIPDPEWDSNLYINGSSIVPMLIEREGTLFNIIQAYANTGLSPHYETRKARGTMDTPLPVLLNDDLGDFTNYGYDGTAFDKGTQILAEATENWTNTNKGSRVVIKTKENGTNSLLNKVVIENDGTVNIPESSLSKLNAGDIKNAATVEYVQDYVANNSGLPVGFYEEGTSFTPTISGYTFTVTDSEYVRKGNDVLLTFVLTNVNGSGALDISGLPFTSVGSDNYGGVIFELYGSNLSSADISRLRVKSKSGVSGLLITYVDDNVIPSGITMTNGVLSCTISYKTNVYTP